MPLAPAVVLAVVPPPTKLVSSASVEATPPLAAAAVVPVAPVPVSALMPLRMLFRRARSPAGPAAVAVAVLVVFPPPMKDCSCLSTLARSTLPTVAAWKGCVCIRAGSSCQVMHGAAAVNPGIQETGTRAREVGQVKSFCLAGVHARRTFASATAALIVATTVEALVAPTWKFFRRPVTLNLAASPPAMTLVTAPRMAVAGDAPVLVLIAPRMALSTSDLSVVSASWRGQGWTYACMSDRSAH